MTVLPANKTFVYTEQMDAEGLGSKLLLTPPLFGWYCESISQDALLASTYKFSQCRRYKERLPGLRKGFWVTSSRLSPKTAASIYMLVIAQRALRLKKFNPDWSREIFNPYDWNFQSRIELFNLDWNFQSRLKISIPTLIIPHKGSLIFNLDWNVQSRLKISIWDWPLESFNPGGKSWIFSIFGPSGRVRNFGANFGDDFGNFVSIFFFFRKRRLKHLLRQKIINNHARLSCTLRNTNRLTILFLRLFFEVL